MTPPCYTFAAAELCERVQLDVHGRQRKMHLSPQSTAEAAPSQDTWQQRGVQQSTRTQEAGSPNSLPPAQSGNRHAQIDLARDCELLASMVQYSCAVMHPEMRDSPVRCWPVQRMFRRCQDRSGSFTVETTAWEDTRGTGSMADGGSGISRSGHPVSTPEASRDTRRAFG